MIGKYIKRFKPGGSRKSHLFLAALLWTFVGTVLMIRGTLWLFDSGHLLYIGPAILLGSMKSLFILDKSARKGIDRILHLTDGSCLGAVYSVKTWLLVAAMMGVGYVLRNSSIPISVVGTIYVTIGWALLFSSRTGWRFWKNANN